MEFILFLAKHYNSNLYGTFMHNCESERVEKQAKTKTVSIWTDVYVESTYKSFLNIFYNPNNNVPGHMIVPSFAMYKLRFWEEYFLKWNLQQDTTKIYIDYNKNIYAKTQSSFFLYDKIQSQINYDINKHKMEDLISVLKDVYLKAKDNEIFNEFSEMTKFYLSNLQESKQQKEDN